MIVAVVIFLSGFYSSILIYHFIGWRKTPAWNDTSDNEPLPLPPCTIIVPVRNEEKHIISCLDGLFAQQYAGAFEIIVADDHSTDNTTQLVEQYIGKRLVSGSANLRLLKLEGNEQAGKSYKKQAITKAVAIASGTIILTTDADCSRSREWLKTMVHFMERNHLHLVSGPVEFSFTNMFEKMQALEFLGLIGIGGAAIKMGTPNMCNGANLAYRRQVFAEVGGYSGNEQLSSGDDEFLMHKVFKKYPHQVGFLKNNNALVQTEPQHKTEGFIQQRKRWVSKSVHYNNKLITVLMALVYLYHVSLVAALAAGFFYPGWLNIFLIIFTLKLIAEGMFLYSVLKMFKRTSLLIWLLPAQPLHVLYVLYIGVAGQFGTFEWKGRNVR
ncbi:MAG: glycosyltransferase [Bacteroidia bacterium]|nr:glycosyltransferase [Bacteroidia bacterium]